MHHASFSDVTVVMFQCTFGLRVLMDNFFLGLSVHRAVQIVFFNGQATNRTHGAHNVACLSPPFICTRLLTAGEFILYVCIDCLIMMDVHTIVWMDCSFYVGVCRIYPQSTVFPFVSRLVDYMAEESVCLLLRAPWYKPCEFLEEHEAEAQYQEEEEDDDDEEYYTRCGL